MINNLISSTIAGIFIGLASVVSGNSTLPQIMFSVGLILVIFLKVNLYTGKIGHTPLKDYKYLLTVILGNFIGVSLMSLYAKTYLPLDTFSTIAEYKFSSSLLHILLSAIFCGMLMCIATSLNNGNYFIAIICVTTFMFCKFDHSIANMFYLYFAPFSWWNILRIITAIIGNAIGAKIIFQIMKIKD